MICMHIATSYSILSNGLKPVVKHSRTQPKAHISVLKLNLPLSYSGLMYLMVPAYAALVALVCSKFYDIPKSINFMRS